MRKHNAKDLNSLKKGDFVIFAARTNYNVFPQAKVLLRLEDCVLLSDDNDMDEASEWWTIRSLIQHDCIKKNSEEDRINNDYWD